MTNPNEEFNGDPWVQAVQIWYNTEYRGKNGYVEIDEDGIVGPGTCKALVRALQIELGISTPNGNFGPATIEQFDNTGINESTTNQNLIKILQGGFLCKGIDCRGFDGVYDLQLEFAIESFRNMTGIPGKVMDARHMKALLNTDPFVLQGESFIRDAQQFLNANYSDCFWKDIGLIPCNGVPERNMTKAIIYALQYEEAVVDGTIPNDKNEIPSSVDGIVGTNTLNKAPVLSFGSTKTPFVKILQAALACMHLTDAGLHGSFNADVQQAVSEFQKFMCLNQDASVTLGTVDRKTWASLLISKGDVTRYANGCDCATVLDLEKAQALKAAGYDYVGRYLTGTTVSNGVRVPKALTRAEINAITTAGLMIFAIYQDGGASASYFGYEQGYSDAQKAYEAAKALYIPLPEIIYFAVDYDFTDKQTTEIVIPHFRGINDYFKEHGINYQIGIYGSRNICSRVSDEKLACSSFVADMSTGYSGNMGFRMPENWAFDQIQEYSFSYTSHGTNTFPLDRDVVSGRYSGFDGNKFCGGENYRDVTLHDMEYLEGGKCRCKICGYEVKAPEAQDNDILNENDFLRVKAGYLMFFYYAFLNEKITQDGAWHYSNLDTTSMLLNAITMIRQAYPGEYEYSDGNGLCQTPPIEYTKSGNEMFFDYPLVYAELTDRNIMVYNGFFPTLFNAMGAIVCPVFGLLTGIDAVANYINSVDPLDPEVGKVYIKQVFSAMFSSIPFFKGLLNLLDVLDFTMAVTNNLNTKLEIGEHVVSFPIYHSTMSTKDSMVVFTPDKKIKWAVFNDMIPYRETDTE